MTMLIRTLDPIRDHARVMAFLRTAADYIRLERDAEPSPDVADEFFTDTPPGCDPAQSLHLGMLQSGRLIAIAEMSMGFPDAQTAYVGFLVLVPQARGRGLGRDMLRYLESRAREKHVSAICLGVLDANPSARTFWGREGFHPTGHSGPVTLGTKTQISHRLRKPL